MTESHRHPLNKHRGFTLVEMAIVLMIVGLLLGGLIPTLSAQMESQHINETRKSLAEIQEALVGFAIAKGRLPCPAKATLATGLANAGVEATTAPDNSICACVNSSGSTVADTSALACTGNTVTGVVPWATLGLKETDAWERRYTYHVSKNYADAVGSTFGCTPTTTPTQASFALCSSGNPDVLAASGGTNIAPNVPAIIVSHGKNGAGAYTQQGTQLSASSNADEQENSDGSSDDNYVSHTPTSGFDDLVVWLSNNILLNRMVAAGKLP